MDILDQIDDLIKQATTERSHFYVAKTLQECRKEIMALRYAQSKARDLIESLEPCNKCVHRGKMWVSKCREKCKSLSDWTKAREEARTL